MIQEQENNYKFCFYFNEVSGILSSTVGSAANAHGNSHTGSSFLSGKLSFAELATRPKKNLDKCQVDRTGT